MKRTALIPAIAGLCSLCFSASAQRDTSRIDIGWLSLDRNLTQTISVKGSDLEKMPFMNLEDAIRAWFFGVYTNVGSLAFVVDGNPVTDVNIYPIYEIEEVVLVQNAVGAAAIGGGQQWLAVVTTKRGKEKRGLRVVGQAGPVNANGNGVHTRTNVYHQYYAGIDQRLEKVEYGVSADWIRDVSPLTSGNPGTAYHVFTPLQVQRWRFNGYIRWQPVKGQTLSLGMRYAPQRLDQQSDSIFLQSFYGTERRLRNHLLAPELSWRAELPGGLQQELRVGYLSSYNHVSAVFIDSTTNGQPAYSYVSEGIFEQKASQLYLRERLGYSMKKGDWSFRPAVNLFYDHIVEKLAYATATFSQGGYGGVFVLPPLVLGPGQVRKGDQLYLTPSVDIGFGRAIDLTGGIQVNLRSGENTIAKAVLPFVSMGVDVMKFGGGAPGSLKLFGSYAQRAQVFLDDYSLFDLSGGGGSHSLDDVYRLQDIVQMYGPIGGPLTTVDVPFHYPTSFWTWQTGIAFSLPGDKLRVSYGFEQRKFNTPYYVAFIGATSDNSYAFVPVWKSDLHHLDIRVKVKDGTKWQWETGLGITGLKSKEAASLPAIINTFPTYYAAYIMYPQGEWVNGSKFSWTGGWVNRLRAGSFEAGVDILYHFGEHISYSNGYGGFVAGPRLNSVMTPNVFVGYQWKLAGVKTLGMFLESRGLARSKSSDLPDGRRYYTIGGSLGL